jgi:hypothetical protein
MERWGTNKESTSESITSFSIDSKVEEDVCFLNNSRGCTIAQVEEERSAK